MNEGHTIIPYIGYGDSNHVRLRGRVLARSRKELKPPALEDSGWTNFKRMARRWFTSEVADAAVEVTLEVESTAEKVEVKTDKDGYFTANVKIDADTVDSVWLRLIDPAQADGERVKAEFISGGSAAKFGIISDIDDTVIASGATNYWVLVKTTLLGNIHTRTIFPGVAEFYGELTRGGDNPIFYITSSPWNLYGFLRELFVIRKVPAGPLFMTDWGFDRDKFLKPGHREHKIAALRELFEFYPDLQWVLFGDSGEKDPEIYAEIVKEFPGRVKAVYIRDVNGTAERRDSVAALASGEVDLVLCKTTEDARSHALKNGFIAADGGGEPQLSKPAKVS